MLWPLIHSDCLAHDKCYQLSDVHQIKLPDPKSHFGVGHQNIAMVLKEVAELDIPRVL
jgi:hypothetical protein